MNMNATVQHDQEGKQFYIALEGARAYLAYMDLGKKTLDIYRTFVPNARAARGWRQN